MIGIGHRIKFRFREKRLSSLGQILQRFAVSDVRKVRWGRGRHKSTNLLKYQRKTQFCAFMRRMAETAHNLKVAGSNPAPATKKRR